MTICVGVASRDFVVVIGDSMLTTQKEPPPMIGRTLDGNVVEVQAPPLYGVTSAGEQYGPTSRIGFRYHYESNCKVFPVGSRAYGAIAGDAVLARAITSLLAGEDVDHPREFGRRLRDKMSASAHSLPRGVCGFFIAHNLRKPELLMVDVMVQETHVNVRVRGLPDGVAIIGSVPEQLTRDDVEMLGGLEWIGEGLPSPYKEKAILCAIQSLFSALVRKAQRYEAADVGGVFHGAMVSRNGWSGFTPRLTEANVRGNTLFALSTSVHRAPGLWCQDHLRQTTLILPTPSFTREETLATYGRIAPMVTHYVFSPGLTNVLAVVDADNKATEEMIYLSIPRQPLALVRKTEGSCSISIRDEWREFKEVS